MSGRGVHFAITEEELDHMIGLASDGERINYLHEVVEERWEEDFVCETDKAWLSIDVCLNNGQYSYGAEDAKCRAVLAGQDLIEEAPGDYIIALRQSEVANVALQLADFLPGELARMFDKLVPDRNEHILGEPHSEEDRDYVVANYRDLTRFFASAAKSNRAVIFSVNG